MNNLDKQYTDLVNDAYMNYLIEQEKAYKIKYNELSSNGFFEIDLDWQNLSQEEFINKIKTDDEFAKKWGFQVYTRELSLDERKEILYSRFRKGPMIVNGESYIEGAPTDINFEFFNIPRRTISLTYNNQTIEIYE